MSDTKDRAPSTTTSARPLHSFRLESTSCRNAEPIASARFGLNPHMPPHRRQGSSLHYALQATTLRGGERHASFLYCIALRLRRRFTLDEVSYNTVGGTKGAEATGAANPRWIAHCRVINPLIELYGCGSPAFIEGAVSIGDMVADDPFTVSYDAASNREDMRERRPGVRRSPLNDPALLPLLSDVDQAQAGAEENNLRSVIARALKKLEPTKKPVKTPVTPEAVLTEIARRSGVTFDSIEAAEARRDAIIANQGAVSTQLPIDGPMVIPAGTRMHQFMAIEQASELACGLFIDGLHQHALRVARVGGHAHRGAGGYISRSFVVSRFDEANDTWMRDSEMQITPWEGVRFTDNNDSGILRTCWDRWQTADLSQFDFSVPVLP